MWARIESGTVAEITDIDPAGRFHPSLEWVEFDGRTSIRVGWRWDGENFSPPPSEQAPERREQAIDWIDATAGRIRAEDRSLGKYLDAEYQIVAEALVAYRNDPDGEVPEAVQSYADAEGLTVKAAAEQIAEAAARAVELLQAVRRIRLAGKAAVRDADDEADMLDIARPFIDQLEALATPASADD